MQLIRILVASAFSLAVTGKFCVNTTIPIQISARQAKFDQVLITSNSEAVCFARDFTTSEYGGNLTNRLLQGYNTVTGAYNISAKFCRPSLRAPGNATIQLLIHGIGFDKTYWDLAYNGYNYSYENVAVDEYGFSTLAIDRLAIGNSSHGEPLNEIQAPLSMEAIRQVTQMLRNGTVPGVAQRFNKVIHVGHSFGSFLSYLLVTIYPNASDGLVLTGYSNDATWFKQTIAGWNLHMANLNQPLRFGRTAGDVQHGLMSSIVDFVTRAIHLFIPSSTLDRAQTWQDIATTEFGDLVTEYNSTAPGQNLPNGYLTWSDWTANILAFFYPPNFDLSISIVAEQTKQPTTLGELLTIGLASTTAPDFFGPVLTVTGLQDMIYCGGDCLSCKETGYDSIPAAVAASFPNASRFDSLILPATGHGINFHYNSVVGYRAIQNWLVHGEL